MTKFFTPRNLAWMSTALVVLTSLQSCYKEDAQELYQRQYVTSVALADLQDQANIFNKQIGDLQLAINNLRDREPISKLIYETTGTDTTGAFMTLGNTTIYIPFGRNGRDGKDGQDGKDGVTPAFDVTIGADGNWYINGRNTGRRAQGERGIVGEKGEDGKDGKDGRDGKDACTPTFSAAQDKDNATDTHFYWTVTWCDGRTEFIMANGEKVQAQARDGRDGVDGKDGRDGKDGETGPQGPKGEDGRPGVISPITQISYNAQGDSVIIRTTYPNMPKISIPLHPDLMFDIQPEKSVDAEGKDVSSQYQPATRELTLEVGQTITFPFVKDASLKDVTALFGAPFKYSIDQTAKTITLTAPTLSRITEAEPRIDVNFSTRKPTSNETHSNNLVIVMPKKFYVNYFQNPYSGVATQLPSSRDNMLSIPTNQNFDHYQMVFVKDETTQNYNRIYAKGDQRDLGIATANLNAHLHQPIAVEIPKSDNEDYQEVMFQDFVWNRNDVLISATSRTPQPNEWVLITQNPTRSTTKANYVPPISWNTFSSQRTIRTNGKSEVLTLRLKRLAQHTTLRMRNPKKWLGLPDNEPFDASRITLATPSPRGFFANLTASEPEGYVTEVTGTASYNANTDILEGWINSFPQQDSRLYLLLITYTRADGTVVRKVVHGGQKNNMPQLSLAGPGGSVTYNIDVPGYYPDPRMNNTFVQTANEDGRGTVGSINTTYGNSSGIRDVDPALDPF